MALKKTKDYTYHCGIRLRIYPSDEQKHIIAVNDGAQRFVYNKLVAVNNELYNLGKVKAPCKAITDRIAFLKNTIVNVSALETMYPFLESRHVDSQAVANGILNYRNAWSQYRKVPGVGVPKFHRKSLEKNYKTNPHYQNDTPNVRFLDKSHMALPKLGRVRVKGSSKYLDRYLPRMADINACDFIRVSSIKISRDVSDRYFATLQLASDIPFVDFLPKTGRSVGIDVNVDNFYTDSFGNIIPNQRYKKSVQDKIADLQRIVSRRCLAAKKRHVPLRNARNYQKARVRLARLQNKVALQRSDYINRCSKQLVENQDLIVSEDLKVKNLLKNHRLAYSVSDVSWSELFRQLEYKSYMYGKTYIKVNPKNTTQTCSSCGYILSGEEKLTLKDRWWVCPSCGKYHVRDVNAAVNILCRGISDSDDCSVKSLPVRN